MKKYIYICLAILCISLNSYAQKETNWWYFGVNAGLNFNILKNATASDGTVVPNMPQPVVGPLNTGEGCFTVSTFDGNLLFSSDGNTVYDKNGDVMENGTGLLGGSSATQSGIAVPKPGSLVEYYIITVPQDNASNGIRYSIVDISLNGGLGKVTSKNSVILAGIVDENIAAVPNTNGRDYWLINRTKQKFSVWAITSSGISATPNQTISSTAILTPAASYVGEIIVSPDYTKLVACTWLGRQIVSSDFNPTTGMISNIRVLTFSTTVTPYGGSFSPNSQYIYIGSGYDNGAKGYVNTWTALRAGTAFKLLSNGVSNFRKGSDNRLYGNSQTASAATGFTKNLYVVMNPDAGGTNVKFFSNYLLNFARIGLPTFVAGFIRIIPKEQPFACAAHSRTYSVEVDLTGGNAPARIEWNFGDGTAIVNQTTTSTQSKYTQQHSYNNAGTYTITITPYRSGNVALPPIYMSANIVNCTLKTNLMTRSALPNSKEVQ